MLIFQFTHPSNTVAYVTAETKQEAIDCYNGESGCDETDYEVKELTDDEADEIFMVNMDSPEPEDGDEDYETYDQDDYIGGYKIERTLRDEASLYSGTAVVCTNDY